MQLQYLHNRWNKQSYRTLLYKSSCCGLHNWWNKKYYRTLLYNSFCYGCYGLIEHCYGCTADQSVICSTSGEEEGVRETVRGLQEQMRWGNWHTDPSWTCSTFSRLSHEITWRVFYVQRCPEFHMKSENHMTCTLFCPGLSATLILTKLTGRSFGSCRTQWLSRWGDHFWVFEEIHIFVKRFWWYKKTEQSGRVDEKNKYTLFVKRMWFKQITEWLSWWADLFQAGKFWTNPYFCKKECESWWWM